MRILRRTALPLKDRSGLVILGLLFIMILIAGVGISVLIYNKNQAERSAQTVTNEKAFRIAQSGVEWAVQASVDNGWQTPAELTGLNGDYSPPGWDGAFILQYDQGNDMLVSTAMVAGSQRQVNMKNFSQKIAEIITPCAFPADVTYPATALKGSDTAQAGPGTLYYGDLDLKGDSGLSIAGPSVVYIKGDLTLTSGASLTVSGDVMLVVEGRVTTGGDAQLGINGGSLYIHAGGNVDIGGKSEVNNTGAPADCLITSAGDITVSSNALVNAGLYAAGNMHLENNAEVNGAVGWDGQGERNNNATLSLDETAGANALGSDNLDTCMGMPNGLGGF